MRYYEVSIKPASGGFGEYNATHERSEWHDNIADILNDISQPWYELGVDDLPEDVEDIRGLIHDQPTHVYALPPTDDYNCPTYFGVEVVDE